MLTAVAAATGQAFFALLGPELHRRSYASAHGGLGGGAGADGSGLYDDGAGGGGLGGGASGGALGVGDGLGGGGAAGASWAPWFALPYLPDPAADPVFAPFFAPQWRGQLQLSLLNFLSLVFRATPLPKLLLLEKWHRAPTQQALRADLAAGRRAHEATATRLCHADRMGTTLLGAVRELCEHAHRRAVDQVRV